MRSQNKNASANKSFRFERMTTTSYPQTAARQNELLHRLIGDRSYTPQQQAELESAAREDYTAQRAKLLAGSLTASQVAQRLGISRQTLYRRVRAGAILGILENGRLHFPIWEFDSDDAVVRGLAAVLSELKASDFAQANWLMRPNPYLEGRTPIEVLKAGETERVTDLARAVGVS